jgi:BirA family biotin operon repressor/biotin-[acetyl-CoA-carboxylase] ligase
MASSPAGGDRWAVVGGSGSWPVLWFRELGSTNEEALARARAGTPGGRWFAADRQTSGRGRRSRPWISDAGNLHATALLIDPCAPLRLSELPFVAAVAIHAAVARVAVTARSKPSLKWPNDLMFDGRKACGLLLEASTIGDGRTAVAIGWGVNCVSAPRGTETPATSLLAEGISIRPEEMLAELDVALRRGLATWDGGHGFAEVRRQWSAAATGIGGPIRVRLHDRELHGIFEAIDESGRLILRETDGGRRIVSAGDVFFPPDGGNEGS